MWAIKCHVKKKVQKLEKDRKHHKSSKCPQLSLCDICQTVALTDKNQTKEMRKVKPTVHFDSYMLVSAGLYTSCPTEQV